MSNESTSSTKPTPTVAGTPTQRRSFLRHGLAAVFAGILATGPVAAVLAFLFDPLLRRRASGAIAATSDPAVGGPMVFVTELSSLPGDGTPIRYPISQDLVDAWNRESDQPVGAIFLRRTGDHVEALNAICPHAGCFVKFTAVAQEFLCPCHDSAFSLDGQRIESPGHINPSPRALDPLQVVRRVSDGHGGGRVLKDDEPAPDGHPVEIHVRFVNFRTGTAERIVKT